ARDSAPAGERRGRPALRARTGGARSLPEPGTAALDCPAGAVGDAATPCCPPAAARRAQALLPLRSARPGEPATGPVRARAQPRELPRSGAAVLRPALRPPAPHLLRWLDRHGVQERRLARD